jgi:octaprenyl-diphosphate synthase
LTLASGVTYSPRVPLISTLDGLNGISTFTQVTRMDWGLVQGPVRRELAQVDRQLVRLFRSPIAIVNAVGLHFLSTRGKKFRPTLLLLVSRLEGPARRPHVTSATVVELIHAAALIHDDSVDKSSLRRGLPTVNHIWNDDVSIVVGDFLYSKAFETLVREELLRAMRVLADVTHHMAIGEALEIDFEGKLDLQEKQYFDVIAAKTASLMGGACEIGAASPNGDAPNGAKARAARFRRFGHAVGMAFQITDDVIDFLGHPSETGKKLGTDLREGKVTLPLIGALATLKGKKRDRLAVLAAKRRLDKSEFKELVGLIEEGDGFAYAMSRARLFADRAKRLLGPEPDSSVKRALGHAVDYAVGRTR